MNPQSYFYNCSPEYINSIDPDLYDQVIQTISQLPKRQTQSEINSDLFWYLTSDGWFYDSVPTGTDGRQTNPMKNLLLQIVQALVDNPEQVQINEIEGTQTVVLELIVATSDLGKVIGKQGRTANAIRVLLNGASGKAQKRHVLEIVG